MKIPPTNKEILKNPTKLLIYLESNCLDRNILIKLLKTNNTGLIL